MLRGESRLKLGDHIKHIEYQFLWIVEVIQFVIFVGDAWSLIDLYDQHVIGRVTSRRK